MPNAKKQETTASPVKIPELMEMLEAGVHFGHERSKRNPKMEPYIFTQRNRISIVDLEVSRQKLEEAARFVFDICTKSSREILFVGTKRQARESVRKNAEAIGMPYITKRWLGGTLTNFTTILKSIEKLEELKNIPATSKWEKLTKKERAVVTKETQRLEEVLEGIKAMRTLPAAVVVVGAYNEKLAVREANSIGIPVIGIVDTNANPQPITYPIPGNDDALRSIELIMSTLVNAIRAARGEQAKQGEDKKEITATKKETTKKEKTKAEEKKKK